MINITLPDGSSRPFEHPVSVGEVAASIGPGLAKAALAGKVDGKLVDTSFRIEHDAGLEIVTEKHPDALEVLRHSTAHLLAQAVQRLYPGAQVTIGPVIDNGFYYDFAYERPFTPDDLPKIEAEMLKIVKEAIKVERLTMPRDEAVAFFSEMGEKFKAEIIGSIPSDQDISLYRQGDFIDLCRGPHVPGTDKLRAFKLMKVAGAYWRGDSNNQMLSRIYGTAWLNDKDLKAYLHQLEEAEKRDHRKIAKAQDLFHLQEEAPGMVFWHPKGWAIWQVVEQYMRGVYRASGYQEVRCPQILDVSLWKRSGHWDNYKDNMFFTESEKREYALKPMNCPGHVQVFNHGLHSYRDLPIRYGEFGGCHRNEPSGALHGILRVRNFTQDDGHIFCTEGQIESEVTAFHVQAMQVYGDFGFSEVALKIALRPDQAPRQRRGVGQGRRRATCRARSGWRRVGRTARRGRVLRPEDRVPPQGFDRPRLATGHDAGRFHDARAPGRRICGRKLQQAPSGHAAPGDRGVHGAFHRHPDREPRRQPAAMAGAGPGGRPEHHRCPGRCRLGSPRSP